VRLLPIPIPPPRQQGVGGEEANTGTPRWSWARRLGRVLALDMATCPLCRRGALRLMATITHEAVITRLLRHLHLASVPPPLAPARSRQATFDWVASGPQRRVWARRRHARRGGFLRTCRRGVFQIPSQAAFQTACPEACPLCGTPLRPPRPRPAAYVHPQEWSAVWRSAWLRGARAAPWAGPPAGGAGGLQGARARGARAKRPFVFPIRRLGSSTANRGFYTTVP